MAWPAIAAASQKVFPVLPLIEDLLRWTDAVVTSHRSVEDRFVGLVDGCNDGWSHLRSHQHHRQVLLQWWLASSSVSAASPASSYRTRRASVSSSNTPTTSSFRPSPSATWVPCEPHDTTKSFSESLVIDGKEVHRKVYIPSLARRLFSARHCKLF